MGAYKFFPPAAGQWVHQRLHNYEIVGPIFSAYAPPVLNTNNGTSALNDLFNRFRGVFMGYHYSHTVRIPDASRCQDINTRPTARCPVSLGIVCLRMTTPLDICIQNNGRIACCFLRIIEKLRNDRVMRCHGNSMACSFEKQLSMWPELTPKRCIIELTLSWKLDAQICSQETRSLKLPAGIMVFQAAVLLPRSE